MAMGSGHASGRGRRRRLRAMSEINVTPVVDVMLVLLIVFMVAAPLMVSGVPVDLPKTSANALKADTQPLSVTVRANGQVFLQESPIDIADLADRLAAVQGENRDARIFVRADGAAAYTHVADVMARLQQAGYRHIALLTQPADQK